jgi:hypothetical protein
MAENPKDLVPSWVDDFTEVIGDCFDTAVGPVAYDVWDPDDRERPENSDDPWEVHFYPSLSEMIGGPQDGALVYPGLNVDLISLQESFDEVETIFWCSPSWNRSDRYVGSALDVTGWYQGHPVLLRVYEAPPSDATIDVSIEHRSGRLRIRNPS